MLRFHLYPAPDPAGSWDRRLRLLLALLFSLALVAALGTRSAGPAEAAVCRSGSTVALCDGEAETAITPARGRMRGVARVAVRARR